MRTHGRSIPVAGAGVPPQGGNSSTGSLDRVRVDFGGQALTTNQGVAIADNQNSLKIGLRRPTALEDFILRKKSRTSTTSASRSAWCMHAGRRRTAISKTPANCRK